MDATGRSAVLILTASESCNEVAGVRFIGLGFTSVQGFESPTSF